MNELVSVVVPIYNSEKYLYKCIDSILKQTYRYIEVILINDGSIDRSLEICNSFQEKDNRVIIKNIPNGGVSNARNIGISISKGKYICFVDSDDFLPENYIQCLYNEIEKNSSFDLVMCGIKNVGSTNTNLFLENDIFRFEENNKKMWVDMNKSFLLYGPVNKIYKSNIIKKYKIGFNRDISYGEDLIFNFDYLKYVNGISIINSTQYYYVHDNTESLSKKYRYDRFSNEIILYNKILSLSKEKKIYSHEMQIYLCNRIFDTAYNCIFDIINQLNFLSQYKEIKYILSNDLTKYSICLSEKKAYSRYIVFFMRHKNVLLLIIYLTLRSKAARR